MALIGEVVYLKDGRSAARGATLSPVSERLLALRLPLGGPEIGTVPLEESL